MDIRVWGEEIGLDWRLRPGEPLTPTVTMAMGVEDTIPRDGGKGQEREGEWSPGQSLKSPHIQLAEHEPV